VGTSVIISQYMQLVHCLCNVGIRLRVTVEPRRETACKGKCRRPRISGCCNAKTAAVPYLLTLRNTSEFGGGHILYSLESSGFFLLSSTQMA